MRGASESWVAPTLRKRKSQSSMPAMAHRRREARAGLRAKKAQTQEQAGVGDADAALAEVYVPTAERPRRSRLSRLFLLGGCFGVLAVAAALIAV